MIALDSWLNQATLHLSKDSSAQVRSEIHEHYESAREAALSGGATPDEADRSALTALGDAKAANRQYRRVLLTAAEARMLRHGNWEARALCARPWLKVLLPAVCPAVLLAAGALYLTGGAEVARVMFAGGLIMSLWLAAIFLPVYTPSRGRAFRCLKCMVMVAALLLAFWPDALKYSWLLISCLWSQGWIEWTRVSMRRKLPVAKWPKQLYL